MKQILGTMTFGESVFAPDVKAILDAYFSRGGADIDTAYVYNEGQSETLLGGALAGSKVSYSIATKVHPRVTGRLDAEAVRAQCAASLERLQRKSVDLLYLHFPDPATPVEGPLAEVMRLYDEGKIGAFGLSNFPAWMVYEVFHLCDKHGWIRPVVYEGMYNPLTRRAEEELNACLDALSMKFYAYNPLAGGLLTGRYASFEDDPGAGRFTNRPNYRGRYWKKSYFDAIAAVRKAAGAEGIPLPEASLRYLAHHSMLSEARGDGVILGASKISHLTENMDAFRKGPLPASVLGAFEAAWEICRGDSPKYFTLFQKPAGA